MKQNFRRLALIDRFIVSVDHFYVVDIENSRIYLQGKYDSQLIRNLKKCFTFFVNDNGFTEGCPRNPENTFVRIIFT